MLAVIMGFSSMILSCLEKTTIESTLDVKKSSNPKELKLKMKENKLMFAYFVQNMDIELFTYDLKNGPQIFDY